MESSLQELCFNVIIRELGWPNSQKLSTVVHYKEAFEDMGMPIGLVKQMIAMLFGDKVWEDYGLSGRDQQREDE